VGDAVEPMRMGKIRCCYLFFFIIFWRNHVVSATSPLVGFDELNDNTIKSLTSLLSVEQEIEFIAYTCGLWNEKCI
jgi:hypothetical protein